MDYTNYNLYSRYARGVYVDQEELNRRWNAVRKMYAARGLGMMIVFNARNQGEGEWLTGLYSPSPEWPSGGIILPMGGGIVTPMSVRPYPETHGEGFGGIECTPNPMVKMTQGFELTDIKDYLLGANGIAVVNPEYMSAELKELIRKELPDTYFEDVSREFYQIMMVKNEKEMEAIMDAVKLHDEMAQTIRAYVRPERLESEVVKNIRRLGIDQGSNGENPGELVDVELTSSPDGQPASQEPFWYPGRRLAYGDRVNIRFCAESLFGVFSQIARTYCIGEPCQETKEMWQTAVEASALAASLLKPGVKLAEVQDKVNEFLEEKGWERDEQIFVHGIGYKPVCYPYVLDGAQGVDVEENMYMSIHPMVKKEGKDGLSCGDTYIVTKEGAKRLSKMPQELIIV